MVTRTAEIKKKILFWLAICILLALNTHHSHARSPSIVYEECPMYEEYYDLKGGSDELKQRSQRHEYNVRLALCAEIEGLVYRIESPVWGEEYRYISVELVEDLDGDGWPEAIIDLSTGGNGCCFKKYLVAYLGSGFFKVNTDEFFTDAEELQLRTYKDQTLLLAVQRGVTKNSLIYESFGQYLIEFGELKLLDISKNSAVVVTDFSVTQKMAWNKKSTYQVFVDEDTEADAITCSVWGRYNLLKCELSLSTTSARVPIPTWCWKISFTSSKTKGLKDLICNLNQVFKVDSTGKYMPYSAQN